MTVFEKINIPDHFSEGATATVFRRVGINSEKRLLAS
jgi:hypothetical protein